MTDTGLGDSAVLLSRGVGLEFHREHIPQGGMTPLTVVGSLNVPEHILCRHSVGERGVV